MEQESSPGQLRSLAGHANSLPRIENACPKDIIRNLFLLGLEFRWAGEVWNELSNASEAILCKPRFSTQQALSLNLK